MATTTQTFICTGCGRNDFKKQFGLTQHQKKCAGKSDTTKTAEAMAQAIANRAADKACEDLNDLPAGSLSTAQIIDFPESITLQGPNPQDLAVVGKILEFNPIYLGGGQWKAMEGKPVRVTKVNPKTISVETEDGQGIKTEAWMMQASDKPFNPNTSKPIRRMDAVQITGNIRLTGDNGKGIWIAQKSPNLEGKVQIARLGGGGRYYTVPASVLTVIDADVVAR